MPTASPHAGRCVNHDPVSSLAHLTDPLADRHRIELGAGGMATVYLAHDLRHDRDVAARSSTRTSVPR